MFFKYKINKQAKNIVKQIDYCDEQLLFLKDFKFPENHKATMSFLWSEYWNLNVPKQGQSGSVAKSDTQNNISGPCHFKQVFPLIF